MVQNYLIIDGGVVVNVIVAAPADIPAIQGNHQAIIAATDVPEGVWIDWLWDGTNFSPPPPKPLRA